MQSFSRLLPESASDKTSEPSITVLAPPGREERRLVGPFVKWAGGKTRLLPRLLPHVPNRIRDYYEPFVGGGAMYFAIRNRVAGRCHLFDLNEELINAWRVMKDRPLDLLGAFDDYHASDSEAFYYEVRKRRPVGDVERAARFIYLNQTAWNGLWRVNKYGEFNVPWGARPFKGLTASRVSSLQTVLANTSVEAHDFRISMERAREGDFAYLDPPYLPVSDTSKFFFYTERRFRAPDLSDLARACAQLTERGVHWVLSNRDTPIVRELFGESKIIPITARRSVAAQNRQDVEPIESPEVIIVGRVCGVAAG